MTRQYREKYSECGGIEQKIEAECVIYKGTQEDPRATEVTQASPTNNRTAEDVSKVFRRSTLNTPKIIRFFRICLYVESLS